jgi:hypothetical protein
MPRSVFGAEPAGQIVAPVKRGTVTGEEVDAPSGAIAGTWPCRTWHYPLRYRTANALRSRTELASRYQAALSRRIRGSYTIRPAIRQRNCGRSGKYPPRNQTANSGQLAASIRPVVSPAYSGQIAGHHPPRGLAANSRRESIRPVNAMRRRPVIGAAKSGSQGRALSAPLSPLRKRPSVRIR